MKVKEKLIKMIGLFERVMFSNHSCIACGREILDGTKFQVCDTCKEKMDLLDGFLCCKCGDGLQDGVLICENCKNFDYDFKENRSYAYYEEVASSIVKGLKYGHKKYFAKHIAEMMFEIKDYFDDIDVITFVPITRERRRGRGYNQAEEIAKEIGKMLGNPVVDSLVKVSDGKHQAELAQSERMKNLIGSFAVKEDVKEKIKGKVVLVVDDVFTTGATLNECAKTLKRMNPKYVKTVTFAKTKFNLSK